MDEILKQLLAASLALPGQIRDSVKLLIPDKPPRRSISSSTKEKQRVINRRKSMLFDVSMANLSAATNYYLLLLDKASEPAQNGDIPVIQLLVPAGTTGYLTWANGRPFTQGIVAVASTTADFVTLPATAELWFDAVIDDP